MILTRWDWDRVTYAAPWKEALTGAEPGPTLASHTVRSETPSAPVCRPDLARVQPARVRQGGQAPHDRLAARPSSTGQEPAGAPPPADSRMTEPLTHEMTDADPHPRCSSRRRATSKLTDSQMPNR